MLSRPALRVLRCAPRPTNRSFLTIVQQGRSAWRLTLGRSPKELQPGLHFYLPLVQSFQRIDLREASIDIGSLGGFTADNVPVKCSGSLFYRITDGYSACFNVQDVVKNVEMTGTSAMRSVLGHFTYDQVISDRNSLNERLRKVIGNSISNWGVETTRFEIQNFSPANREVERQLELQMEAERNRRKQLLDTQAAVNVAEGHKQRVILESEGALEARSNDADAAFKTVFREAEARQAQAVMESEALAKQIDAIARSMTDQEPTPVQRKIAADLLLEIRRLEQLKAIASSKTNSTYFFGDQSSMGSAYGVDLAERVKSKSSGASSVT